MVGWCMTPRDLAEMLLRKAREDLEAMRALVESERDIADENVGFLGQQSVEKALKAVLTARGVRFGRSHDPDELISFLAESEITRPDWLNETAMFGPYAVTGRYVELRPQEEFDRDVAVRLAQRVLTWAEEQVAPADPG